MKRSANSRRNFLRSTLGAAAGAVVAGSLPAASSPAFSIPASPPRLKFSVIGMNHGHIYSQVEAVIRGGGQLVNYYAREPELLKAFAKRHPTAKQARSEAEILEDPSIQLVLSAS